jgi:hypothetical protein
LRFCLLCLFAAEATIASPVHRKAKSDYHTT